MKRPRKLTTKPIGKRSKPLLIAAAINGAQHKPQHFPLIPVTAADAAREALAVYNAGARYIHFHAREPLSGEQFADLDWFTYVRAETLRQIPDAAVSFAASRKGLVGKQITSNAAAARLVTPELSRDRLIDIELLRAVGMGADPDLGTIFTALETKMNPSDPTDSDAATASYQHDAARDFADPAFIAAYYTRLRELYAARQIVPEYEITTMGGLWTLETLIRRGWVAKRPHLIFLFGFSARLPISREVFELSMSFVRYLRNHYGISPAVTVGAVMGPSIVTTRPRSIDETMEAGKHDYLELLDWTLAEDTVDCIRVGLEDTPVHFGSPVSNADLVTLIHRRVTDAGVGIETNPSHIRELFGIRRNLG